MKLNIDRKFMWTVQKYDIKMILKTEENLHDLFFIVASIRYLSHTLERYFIDAFIQKKSTLLTIQRTYKYKRGKYKKFVLTEKLISIEIENEFQILNKVNRCFR